MTIHFLAGLPRSGNTLLSALLNQNPAIYSSPISPLASYLYDFSGYARQHEHLRRNSINAVRTDALFNSFAKTFYQDREESIIFDREKSWGTPGNLNLIRRHITPNPKIVFTVRDIPEIIASYINIDRPRLRQDIQEAGYFGSYYKPERDVMADALMRPNGEIDRCMLSLSQAFLPENAGVFHIVEYNDLVKNPKKVMDGIYDFIEIPHFKHNFKKIIKLEADNDESLGVAKDMHKVKSSLVESETDPQTVLSEYALQRYSNLEFWKSKGVE